MKILYRPNQNSQQRQHEKKRWVYPIHLAMEATWHKQQGDEVQWTIDPYQNYACDKIITEPEGLPFLSLPHADRVLTDAKNPRWQKNGNFKYHPATYILSAQGCPWHHCRFCVESLERYKIRPVEDVIEELKECEALGFREVFDDAATIADGGWLKKFCNMKEVLMPLSKLVLGCNLRVNSDVDYEMMKRAGFRMVLFGVESANQYTLDRIRKGTNVKDFENIIKASLCGIECHIAVMFGFPWETDTDALTTIRLVHYMLRKGYAKTAQASFYAPQEKTPSGEKKERGKETQRRYVRRIYRVAMYPEFWYNQLKSIKTKEDIAYLWKGVKSCLSK